MTRTERNRLMAVARGRAKSRLAKLYPRAYRVLLRRECKKLGIEPPDPAMRRSNGRRREVNLFDASPPRPVTTVRSELV